MVKSEINLDNAPSGSIVSVFDIGDANEPEFMDAGVDGETGPEMSMSRVSEGISLSVTVGVNSAGAGGVLVPKMIGTLMLLIEVGSSSSSVAAVVDSAGAAGVGPKIDNTASLLTEVAPRVLSEASPSILAVSEDGVGPEIADCVASLTVVGEESSSSEAGELPKTTDCAALLLAALSLSLTKSSSSVKGAPMTADWVVSLIALLGSMAACSMRRQTSIPPSNIKSGGFSSIFKTSELPTSPTSTPSRLTIQVGGRLLSS
jgi:hypothetical protein